MQTSVRFNIQVTADHVIKLPDDVPVGPAQVIVLSGSSTRRVAAIERAHRLVQDCPVQSSDSTDLLGEDSR